MFNYLLYRIGQFIVLALPLKISYNLAIILSDLHYIFAKKDRRTVTENLKAIFPEKSKREISKIRINLFRNFAKYLVDFFQFTRLNKEYIIKNIHLENIHYIDQALSRGKGVIGLTAHLGNWELASAVVANLGYPLWVVALPHKHKKVNDFFNSQRESQGIKVIPLGRAARTCLDLLRQNRMIALAGDRDFTEKGMVVDFFGRPALLPVGPAAFALKTGAPIAAGFMFRNNDDTLTLRFEKLIEVHSPNNGFNSSFKSANKEEELLRVIGQYKGIIEDYIKRFPDQWYMFRKFWISETQTYGAKRT